jgi:hypothetical protein
MDPMERDREADKLALVGAFGVAPFTFGVLGSFLWPLFNSAGDSFYQVYKLSEIAIGFLGGAVFGMILGGILLFSRAKTDSPPVDYDH